MVIAAEAVSMENPVAQTTSSAAVIRIAAPSSWYEASVSHGGPNRQVRPVKLDDAGDYEA
jgi:hypothetical protein